MTKQTHIYSRFQFKVFEEEFTLPDGRVVERFIVRHPGASIIIPLHDDGKLTLIKQYRFAVGEYLYEFPAGTLEENEDPKVCALRELEEEAALKAESIEYLGTIFPTPGFSDEVQHVYLARGLTPSIQTLDEDEEIEIVTLSMNEIDALVKDGAIKDGKTLSSTLFLKTKGIK